ncbi:MAG: PilZ domain-containing protein [Fuerstiella sp.]
MENEIERLLLEAQRSKFIERRTEPRHPFVRPVMIHLRDEPAIQAFSKDLSKQGIGMITDRQFKPGTMAVLAIHSATHNPVYVKCELRWSDPFGKGWFLTGWKFLSSAPKPV